MKSRAPSLVALSSSSSDEYPERITPPSARVWGASSAIESRIRSATSDTRSWSIVSSIRAGARTRFAALSSSGSRSNERPSAPRSLGPARPDPTFPARRPMSWIPLNTSLSPTRISRFSTNSATASSRCQIGAADTSGRSIHCRSSRAPIAVTDSSMTSMRVPPSSPTRSGSSSSRFLRVISSRSISDPGRRILGRWSWAIPPGWISRTY